MSTPNDIIDMFADLHKSIYREVGTLMGRVLESRVPPPTPVKVVEDSNFEERIMKAIDERFASLERSLVVTRLAGQKRKYPETPSDSEDSDDEAVVAKPSEVPSEAVNEIVNGLAATTISVSDEEESVEEEESASADEELTPFKYKGKDYYMDGDCNVYSVDEEGELIEDPVGVYDEKTRRITFNS